YEQMLANCVGVVARPTQTPVPWQEVLEPSQIQRVGFDDEQSLFPHGPRSFHGYRLLQEYLAFPERYMFLEIGGLSKAVRRHEEEELELLFLFDRDDRLLENAVDAADFALFCSPAINLFPKRCDRIHLSDKTAEYHVIPDRTRPMDLEVHSVTEVSGHGANIEETQEFLPFYATNDLTRFPEHASYYALHRLPRVLSAKQQRQGPRSSYVGSEMYVSLVDSQAAPYDHDLRQLAIQALCTNRDLPLHMPVGSGTTDFTMESGAPVESVRCVAGPTPPRPSLAYSEGEVAWRMVSQLSLNYLSLMDDEKKGGAAALRDLLRNYSDSTQAQIRKQIEGVVSAQSKMVTRRLPLSGPIAFGRGLDVALTFDEGAFEGTGVFLLGCVLEEFFAKYVSINSFTRTSIHTLDRGEIMQWPMRLGRRDVI
ncbi:MAG: type VI secretion system baseplate subunit TssF, partial [Planctomycetales bacterium]